MSPDLFQEVNMLDKCNTRLRNTNVLHRLQTSP
jgi:hypothetical protein